MKYSYCTVLSTENFISGVKMLYRGIRKYSDKEVTVFVSDEISKEAQEELKALGMTVIQDREPIFAEGIISKKQEGDRWNKSLFKLVIFKAKGFDKMVYLDSDLLIRANLDELFEKPEWSAVSDKDFYPECGREGLNAGVMVIKPSEEIYNELLKKVEEVSQRGRIFGDQDVINSYLTTWDEEESLHLGNEYNSCFYSDKISDSPKVVHFIFEDKPWMWDKKYLLLKKIKWILRGKKARIKYLSEYLKG